MTNRFSTPRVRFVSTLCAGLLAIVCSAAASVQGAPLLYSSTGNTRAIAVETVTLLGEPFPINSPVILNANDTRTRISLLCSNLDLLQGESVNALSADAEDAAHNHYSLKVEYVGPVPPDPSLPPGTDFSGVYMVVLRLNDAMTSNLGDVLIRLNLHGVASNRVRAAIGVSGGGPADDPGAVPTPLTGSLPPAPTPMTLAQFQGQYNNPAFPTDNDLRRFLNQASWGAGNGGGDLQHVRDIGIPAFITEQFNTPPQFVDPPANLYSDYPSTPLYPISQPSPCDATCVRDNYTLYPLQKQFMLNALLGGDQLRQRIAFALHKLIVVGGAQLNNNEASWYAPYLQTIDRNATGNFRTLLYEITLNPGMGEYLNMRGNSVVTQANPTPNENYAREIMQLFSIGTDVLNQDGTPVLDAQGNRVPSYDQTTIANLARIFTGWDLGPNKTTVINGVSTSVTNYLDPMPLSSNVARYDLNQKTLFGVNFPACTVVSPPCTSVASKQAYKAAELNTAIDALFNHPNTGPYVCTQFIHQLVTSNPSPAYVGRCSAAFANNGSGVRGDMKAVITSILMDPEARGDVKTDPNYGHLREPVLLMANLIRTFNPTTDGVLVTSSSPGSLSTPLGQNVFNPPTVFSYFSADFGLPGTNLVGPEFGILDTSTTYARTNLMNTLFLANGGAGIPANGVNRPTGTLISYSAYQALAGNPTQLVNALNANLMHGAMSAAMSANIVATVTAITNVNPTTQAMQRTQTAIYLIATSAQYQVQR